MESTIYDRELCSWPCERQAGKKKPLPPLKEKVYLKVNVAVHTSWEGNGIAIHRSLYCIETSTVMQWLTTFFYLKVDDVKVHNEAL
jgi:hypothetical protein